MLKAWRRKHEIRKTFSRFLTHEAIDEIGRSPEKLELKFSTIWFHCLFIQVRDDTPEDTQRNIAQIVPICLSNNGIIFDLMASTQLVGFGGYFKSGKTEEEHHRDGVNASTEILKVLGRNVRIVSFCGDIPCGNFGADGRFAFTIAPPNFDRFIAALLDTEFGQITEAPPV